MFRTTERRKRTLVFAAIMLASASWGYHATSAPNIGSEDVLSFDMWCLEMRLYPAARCNSRLTDDVKAYERYRTSAEQFTEQRAAREKRDQQLQQRLNPSSNNQKQGPIDR